MSLDDVPRIAGLSDVAGRYDAFLIDQFGVLHDGLAPYPGAVAALARLKASGARIALVSNSGKRAEPNVRRLSDLGFSGTSYDAFVSSGEVAWSLIKAGALAVRAGARCLHIARGYDPSAIEGLDLVPTSSAEDCELVLIAGSEAERISLDAYRARLAPAARRGIPALCTNPDLVMLTRDGPRFGAGEIARAYEAMGGAVTWIGKPHRAIYEAALAALGQPNLGRTLCIGDSLAHDIAGGQAIGAATLLVTGGIPLEWQEGVVPTFQASDFQWDQHRSST